MFWAVTLESGKRYSQVVESSYHLSMAALEPTTKEINAGNKFVSVMIEHGKSEFLLCTLEYDRVMQVPLDLIFVEGEEVSFFLTGEGTVHLSGYIISDDDESVVSETQLSSELSNESEDDDEDEDENYSSSRLMALDDEDEEDSDDWTPQKEAKVKMSVEKKRKLNESSLKISPENKSNSKKLDGSLEKSKVKKKGGSFREEKSVDIEENGSVNIENDEHIDADTGKRKKSFQDEKKCKKINLSNSLLGSADKRTDIKKSETEVIKISPGNRQKNLSLKQEEESDEDENDDDEHGDDDDEHYMYESDDNEDDNNEEEDDDESEDSDSAEDSDSNNDQESSIGRTPMPSKKTKAILRSPLSTESKLNLPLGREINEIGTKREQNNEVKKTPENKSLKNSPKEKNQGERVPALIPIVKSKDKITTSTPKIGKPEKKRLPGGVEISDFRIGSGPMAKSGKFVHVYYVGKLSNNKEFESVKQGQKPFAFRLGKGEVIKGWDLGIEGMKVGGKRQIIIPPTQGYGNKKQGQIPPNSTLIFDVELKAVS